MDVMARVKLAFFDRKAVMDATDKASRKVLSRFGAFVVRRVKSSLRYRTKPSPAGRPPSVHRHESFTRSTKAGKSRNASPLKELIFFSYEPANRNVVMGPVPFNGPFGIVPPILEEGGVIAARKNPRRRLRRVGGGGEIRLGGGSATSKRNKDGVMVTYAKLKTQAEADRSNRLNAQLYGPAQLSAKEVAARPFMRPGFEVEKRTLPGMWADAIH